MKYVYAALLLHSSSKEINEENVKKVLQSAGIEVEEARVKALTAALSEIDIEEAIKTAATVSAAPVAQAPAQEAPTEEKKKEGPKAEEKKEEALDGLGSLFG